MATKSRSSSVRWNGTIGGVPSPEEWFDTEVVNGVFSRKRPTPLTGTVLSGTRTKFNPKPYSRDIKKNMTLPACADVGSVVKDITFSPDADSLNRASGRAASHFYSDLDLGETIGSIRETAGMIAGASKALSGFYGDVQRRGLKWAMRTRNFDTEDNSSKIADTKNASKAYLQFQFGWGQLAQDAYNSVSELGNRSREGEYVRGRGTAAARGEQPLGGSSAGYRVTLSGDVKNANLRDLNRLGLANPARTAWQLTRLSWVLDWWMGLAQTLGYYGWDTGLQNTQRTTVSATVVERQYQIGGEYASWRTRTLWNRTVSSTPITHIGFVRSDPGVNLSIGQAITAIALLRSRF